MIIAWLKLIICDYFFVFKTQICEKTKIAHNSFVKAPRGALRSFVELYYILIFLEPKSQFF